MIRVDHPAAVEAAGFDFLSVSDRVVIPGKLETHYSYVPGGAFGGAAHAHCFDPLSTIAHGREALAARLATQGWVSE